MNFLHELGDSAKDKVTDFTGVITGRVQYITGCNQYLLQPNSKNKNEWTNSVWVDEQRVTILKKARIIFGNAERPGPDKEAPVK